MDPILEIVNKTRKNEKFKKKNGIKFLRKTCARARTRNNNFPCCARESWKDTLYSRLTFLKEKNKIHVHHA